MAQNQIPRLADVRDGLSNTILLSESAGRPWVWNRASGRLTKVVNNDGDIGATNEAAGSIVHDRDDQIQDHCGKAETPDPDRGDAGPLVSAF